MHHAASIKAELDYPGAMKVGSRGKGVQRLQEWLTFHECATPVDGDFGAATARRVGDYAERKNLSTNGAVSEDMWASLLSPMREALDAQPQAGVDWPNAVRWHAERHLAVHPVEIGGANRGPWVRLYMRGMDGKQFLWCGGFVRFVMEQAAGSAGTQCPIAGSASCDEIADQGKTKDRFIAGRKIESDGPGVLGEVAIFLIRHTATDWVHTGFAFDFEENTFETVEGNTNTDGSRNGVEVASMTRRIAKADFVRLN